jgi:hypothetical protein
MSTLYQEIATLLRLLETTTPGTLTEMRVEARLAIALHVASQQPGGIKARLVSEHPGYVFTSVLT